VDKLGIGARGSGWNQYVLIKLGTKFHTKQSILKLWDQKCLIRALRGINIPKLYFGWLCIVLGGCGWLRSLV